MAIVAFDPCIHYRDVAALWQRGLGDRYAVTERVLMPRIWKRPSYEPGDGVVALEGDRVVAFGMNEIDRAPLALPPRAGVQAIVVDPDCQRQGVGSALLAELERLLVAAGYRETMVGAGLHRFWSGVPDDLSVAGAFFEKNGYTHSYEAIDMVAPLNVFRIEDECLARLETHEVQAVPMTGDTLGVVYDFLTREAAGWRGSMLDLVMAGDMGNVLVFMCRGLPIGCVQTYTPESRCRGANVVWERRYGEDMGGFGAVLIAKAWRGKGLGTCLCQMAAQHIKDRGGSCCYIDWTSRNHVRLYGKIGATVCKSFGMWGKTLGPTSDA